MKIIKKTNSIYHRIKKKTKKNSKFLSHLLTKYQLSIFLYQSKNIKNKNQFFIFRKKFNQKIKNASKKNYQK